VRVPRLYHPQRLATGSTITLEREASRYVAKVLRLDREAPLTLFDGSGGEYACAVHSLQRDGVRIHVGRHLDREAESPLHTTLAQGISRGERMDYTLRKAVEMGVSAIQPLFTDFCQVQIKGERLERRLNHWQGVVRSACEQSGRNRVPPVHSPIPLAKGVSTLPPGVRLILNPGAPLRLGDLPPPDAPITLIAGPEGGFSPGELELLTSQGFVGISMGPRVLRTETAALAALAAIQTLWGDF
jgi:16S rRNA (uracil1498-N3)-methyltransferase